MANEKIMLKAKANQLGISGYRTMGVEELQAAIKKAEGGNAAPAKGKTAAASKGKSSTVAKGKTSTAPAKKKSTGQKTTAKKPSAAKGKASRAASSKGKKATTPAKGTAKKQTPAKVKASSPSKKKAATRSRKDAPARADIDRSKIDWKADTNVGRNGKRAEVMAELRKRNGNYDKVFDALVHRAKAFYPGKTKHDAERMLRWLINRVAYDFVMATEQHTPGVREGYGQSDHPDDVRRREYRAEDRKEREKAERAAKRGGPAKKPASRGKASSGKKKAAKGKRK